MAHTTHLAFQRAFNLELEGILDPRERATESFQPNDEYEEETRRILQEIIQSPEDMNELLHNQSSLLEDITTSLQTVCLSNREPSVEGFHDISGVTWVQAPAGPS